MIIYQCSGPGSGRSLAANEAISNNIANVDTRATRGRMGFESVLQQALAITDYESMDDKVANVDLSRLRGRAYLTMPIIPIAWMAITWILKMKM